MRVSSTVLLFSLLCWSLAGCGPAFNWRDASIAGTSLVVLFPCKPQNAMRVVALGGKDVDLAMTGCDTAGVTVAIGHAHIADPAMVGPVLAQWREATLAGMRAQSPKVSALHLGLASELAQSVAVQALGTRPDGRPVALQAAWFARGTEVFAALWYADAPNADVAEVFFSGLRFR